MTLRTASTAVLIVTLATSASFAQSKTREDLESRLKRLELQVTSLSRQLAQLNSQLATLNAAGNAAKPLADGTVPVPKLVLKSTEESTVRGNTFTRYRLTVENHASIPNELFRAAPDLPPCGRNKNSSRTWVDIHNSKGRRLYGFCAFRSNTNLTQLWFAVPSGSVPPKGVYIVLNDRETKVKHKSNVVMIEDRE